MKTESTKTETIVILSKRELDKMRYSGRLAAKLLHHLEPMVKPGVSTLELNDEAERWTQAKGAKSAPLNYKGFPKSICTSVNEVVCHGIPNAKQILKEHYCQLRQDSLTNEGTPVTVSFAHSPL